MRTKPNRAMTAIPAALLLVAGVAVASPAESAQRAVGRQAQAQAQAAQGPYERGPDPTEASVSARRGSFTVQQVNVGGVEAGGFGSGTIYYPEETDEGTYGAVAVIPGFVSPEAYVAWWGPRLASQGFIVLTIAPNGALNTPNDRGQQLLAGLDYLADDSPAAVRQRLDAGRMAVMGHSMGGGAALYAAAQRSSLQAAVPLSAWHSDKNWNNVRVPTMILAAENDALAANGQHSRRFYDGMSNAPEKAYTEVAGANHATFITNEDTAGKYALVWLKRFVDDDTRYQQWLCPTPDDRNLSEYIVTCPIS